MGAEVYEMRYPRVPHRFEEQMNLSRRESGCHLVQRQVTEYGAQIRSWRMRKQVACTYGPGVQGRYLANQGRATGRIVGWNGIELSKIEVDCTEDLCSGCHRGKRESGVDELLAR